MFSGYKFIKRMRKRKSAQLIFDYIDSIIFDLEILWGCVWSAAKALYVFLFINVII